MENNNKDQVTDVELTYDDLGTKVIGDDTSNVDDSTAILLDDVEIVDDEPILYVGEDAEETPPMSAKDIEEARKEVEEIEVKPVYNNATVREAYEDYNSVDPEIKRALELNSDQQIGTILPTKQVDALAKELSNALLDARASNNKELEKIILQVLNGIATTVDDTGVDETLFRREDAELEQGLYNPKTGKLLSISPVNVGSKAEEIRGEVALLKAAKILDLGEVIHIPLPHSGFWVTVSPPTEKDLIRFYNTMARAKTSLGRASQGYVFGNTSVSLNNDLVNFIKRNIMAVNFKDVAATDIEDKILLNDLPILIWGFARTIYANGFPYRRLCDNRDRMGEDGNIIPGCNDIQEVNLSLDKLLWIDNTMLNDTQKEIFSRQRAKSITLEDYQSFHAQSKFINKTTFKYRNEKGNGVDIDLRQPTLKDHFEDGLKWMDDLIDELDYTVAVDDLNKEEKDEQLEIFMRASMARNWSHYVEAIHIGDNVIKDRESIQSVLAKFGTNRDFSTKFTDAVVEFRNKSVIAGIGIPEYRCPKCHHTNKGDEELKVLTNIIPLSATNLFFLMFITKFQMVITSTETL